MSTESFSPARQVPDPPPSQGPPGATSSAETDLVSAAGLVPPPSGPPIPHPAVGPLAAGGEETTAPRYASTDAPGSSPLPRREAGAQLPTGSWQAFGPPSPAATGYEAGLPGPGEPLIAPRPANPAPAVDATTAPIPGVGVPGAGTAPGPSAPSAAPAAHPAGDEPEVSLREMPTAGFRAETVAPAAAPAPESPAQSAAPSGYRPPMPGGAAPAAPWSAESPSAPGTPASAGGHEEAPPAYKPPTRHSANGPARPAATDDPAEGTAPARPATGDAPTFRPAGARRAEPGAGGTASRHGAAGTRPVPDVPPAAGPAPAFRPAGSAFARPAGAPQATGGPSFPSDALAQASQELARAAEAQTRASGAPAQNGGAPAHGGSADPGTSPQAGDASAHGSSAYPAAPSHGGGSAYPSASPQAGTVPAHGGSSAYPGASPQAGTVPAHGGSSAYNDTPAHTGGPSALAGGTAHQDTSPQAGDASAHAGGSAYPGTPAHAGGAAHRSPAADGRVPSAAGTPAPTGAPAQAGGVAQGDAGRPGPEAQTAPARGGEDLGVAVTAGGTPTKPKAAMPTIMQSTAFSTRDEKPKEEPAPADEADEKPSEEEVLEARRREDRAAVRRAEILLATGNPEDALAEASPALARLASDPDVWLLMARIRIALDDVPGAMRATETAEKLNPGGANVLAVASAAMAAAGRQEDALAAARSALAVDPANPHLKHLVATRLVESGKDRAEADKLARAAVAAMPHEAAFQATAAITAGSRHRRGRGAVAEPEPVETRAAAEADADSTGKALVLADPRRQDRDGEKPAGRRWGWGRSSAPLELPAGPSAATEEPIVSFVESLKSDAPTIDDILAADAAEAAAEAGTAEADVQAAPAYRPPRPVPKLSDDHLATKPWARGGPSGMHGTARPAADWSSMTGGRHGTSWQGQTGAMTIISSGGFGTVRWPMARIGMTAMLGAAAAYACTVLELAGTARIAGAIALATMVLMLIQFSWSLGREGRSALGRSLNTARRVIAAVLGAGSAVVLALAAAGPEPRMQWLLIGAAAAGLLATVVAATEPRSQRRTPGQH